MRDGIVFYRSFYEAVKDLPPEDFKKSVEAIMEYGLNGTEIEASGVAKIVREQISRRERKTVSLTLTSVSMTTPLWSGHC